MKRQTTKLDKIVLQNINEVKDFLYSNLPTEKKQSASNEYKIRVTCPYCDENKHKLNLALNLDWGSFKCFRCGETGTLVKYLKEYNLDVQYIELLSSLSSISLYDIQTLFKSNKTIRYIEENNVDDNIIKIKEFIKENSLLPIKKLKIAKKYALERVANYEDEIENYYADDKYIYIPLTYEDKITSFVARLYIENDNLPRYKMHTIDPKKHTVGFYDEVLSNFSTNSIYITEGYFDSFAINYAFSDYVSISLLGKNKIKSVEPLFANNFSNNTKIYIALDSIEKDKEIINDNIKIGSLLLKIFPNIFVCSLKEGDPSEILKKYGSLYLKECLTKKSMSFIKYKVLNSGKV
jgi:DNA primase